MAWGLVARQYYWLQVVMLVHNFVWAGAIDMILSCFWICLRIMWDRVAEVRSTAIRLSSFFLFMKPWTCQWSWSNVEWWKYFIMACFCKILNAHMEIVNHASWETYLQLCNGGGDLSLDAKRDAEFVESSEIFNLSSRRIKNCYISVVCNVLIIAVLFKF
jgi:hypothetical protein